MLKDMDFGVYGKGVDGYVHYSLAMIVSGKKRKTVRRSWMSSITMRTTPIRTTLILMTLVRMILAVTTSDSKCHR